MKAPRSPAGRKFCWLLAENSIFLSFFSPSLPSILPSSFPLSPLFNIQQGPSRVLGYSSGQKKKSRRCGADIPVEGDSQHKQVKQGTFGSLEAGAMEEEAVGEEDGEHFAGMLVGKP